MRELVLFNIDDDIVKRDFKRVYLFFGEENYLKKLYLDKIKKAVIPPGSETMNLDVFQEKKIEWVKISDACETVPFMNDFRLVIVKDSELFVQGNKDNSEKVAEYIKNMPEFSILVFVEDKVDKRGKLYKAVSLKGVSVECNVPSERELVGWVGKVAAKKGLAMKNDVILYFIRNINTGMEAVFAELEKLSAYIGKGSVSQKDIDDICAKSLEVRIFDMVAAIGSKRVSDALDIYNNMILMKESPIMILAMIARQFRIILQSKYLLEKGFTKSEIARKINQRDFVVAQCLTQAKNFKKKVLLRALEDCLECDFGIKTGKISSVLGVEMIIMKYSE